jgi:hypothetical protein
MGHGPRDYEWFLSAIFFKMLRCKLYNFKLTVNQMAKQTMNCRSYRWTWNAIFPLSSWQLWCQPNTSHSSKHFSLKHTRRTQKWDAPHECLRHSSEMEESWISSITKEASQLLEKLFCNFTQYSKSLRILRFAKR